jgi:hypothetical protein
VIERSGHHSTHPSTTRHKSVARATNHTPSIPTAVAVVGARLYAETKNFKFIVRHKVMKESQESGETRVPVTHVCYLL